jgi:membrane-bound metal-dependent hydrolase YbcI (DUF457 family)
MIIGLIAAFLLIGSGIEIGAAGFWAVLFGSLLPDIDHRNSTLGKCNPFVGFMKHRGHCHSFIGILILSLLALPFGFYPFFMVLLGANLHLLGDKLNSYLPRKKQFILKTW